MHLYKPEKASIPHCVQGAFGVAAAKCNIGTAHCWVRTSVPRAPAGDDIQTMPWSPCDHAYTYLSLQPHQPTSSLQAFFAERRPPLAMS